MRQPKKSPQQKLSSMKLITLLSTYTAFVINPQKHLSTEEIIDADCSNSGRVMRILINNKPIDFQTWKPRQKFKLVCRNLPGISVPIFDESSGQRNLS